MAKAITATSISINSDNYPSLVVSIEWNGIEFKGGEAEGTKPVSTDHINAMNAFMPIVIERGSLNDDWKEELGAYSSVASIRFGETKLALTAKLTKDMDVKDTATAIHSESIGYDKLSTAEQSLITELRREIKKYLDSIDEQQSLFTGEPSSGDTGYVGQEVAA